jgi:hypothetical protein
MLEYTILQDGGSKLTLYNHTECRSGSYDDNFTNTYIRNRYESLCMSKLLIRGGAFVR